jgi:hypothetical protein
MKNQLSKRLFAFILTIMMFTGIIHLADAQTLCPGKLALCRTGCGFICIKCVSNGSVQYYLNQGWHRCYGPRLSERETVQDENTITIFPNPVLNSTNISFSLQQAENVSLKIFDLNGRLIQTIADNIFQEGENEVVWNADDLNAGVYFLQFQSAEYLQIKKVIVTK